MRSATVARRLSVPGGAYRQLAAEGLVSRETAQDITAAVLSERLLQPSRHWAGGR